MLLGNSGSRDLKTLLLPQKDKIRALEPTTMDSCLTLFGLISMAHLADKLCSWVPIDTEVMENGMV